MKQALKASAALALLAQLTPAYAQEAFDLGEITLSASQSETEISRSGTTVEVLTQEDIESAPETKVADGLARLPGVTVSANGGVGTSTTFRIRGLGAGYVPVLLDGIDITDPASSGGGFDWGGLTSGGLSRVEVLKGSQSAQYGSGAVGGVVNLTTFRPTNDGFSGQGSVEFGSYGTRSASLGLGYLGDRVEVAFSASKLRTDGFSARSVGTEADGYEGTQASLFAAYDLTDTARIGMNLLYIDTYGEFDEFGGDGAAPFDEFNTRTSYGGRIFGEFETGNLLHTLALSHFETDRVSSSNGFDTPFIGRRSKAEYTVSFDPSDVASWTLGLEHVRERAGGGEADTTSAFAEVSYAPSDVLDVTASLRYDDSKQFGGQATGRLAAAYRLREDTILRAQLATGYKPPTLFQLTSSFGRADFTPEKSTTFELGLEKQYGDLGFVKATFFYNDLNDQVGWDSTATYCGSGFGCYVQGDYVSRGLEVSGEYALNDVWSLTGAYTYTDAKSDAGRAGRVPRHDAYLGVQGEFAGGWSLGAGVNYVADRVDRDGSTAKLPDYKTVSAHISYRLSDSAEAYVRVENLFDEDYETAGGYATSGRAAYFGIRAEF